MELKPAWSPAFTAKQHVEMLRLGINPATVEARWMRASPKREWYRESAYLREDWDPTYFSVPIIERCQDGFTILLPNGNQWHVETPPGHPLRLEDAGS
jgi:hypothetical protein